MVGFGLKGLQFSLKVVEVLEVLGFKILKDNLPFAHASAQVVACLAAVITR